MPRSVMVGLAALALAVACAAASQATARWKRVLSDREPLLRALGPRLDGRACRHGRDRPAKAHVHALPRPVLEPRRARLGVEGAVSPWLYAGSARNGTRQAGWTFYLDGPSPGAGFVLRGLVEFQWRARKRVRRRRPRWVVVKRRRAVTRAGISGVDTGDPPGTSLASRQIA